MRQVLLYECPGIVGNPRLTEGACAANRRRAAKASTRKRLTTGRGGKPLLNPERDVLIHLGVCLECSGVLDLLAEGRIPPPVRFEGSMVRQRPAKEKGARPRIGHDIYRRRRKKIEDLVLNGRL